jgi:flavin reductase (DIM6/NTAB) family NADH-FMN oxidoreductase RutF
VADISKLVGPFPDGADPEAYDRIRRRVLWRLPTGLFLVGSSAGGGRNLMTANLVAQLCVVPKLVGVAVEVTARTHELIEAGGSFALSLLGRGDRALVRKFVKPAVDDRAARTLNGVAYFDAPVSGAPVLARAVAYVDCRLERTIAFGSHSLFIGEVVDAAFGSVTTAEDAELLRVEDTRMSYGG